MKGGMAKLPRGTFVAPLFYRLDRPNQLRVEQPTYCIKEDWWIRAVDLYEYVPEVMMDCSDFTWNNIPSHHYFCQKWGQQYWAAVKLPYQIHNKLAHRCFVGFVLFVGDLCL